MWFDATNLKPGGFWDRVIDEAIDTAACLVLVTSPHTVRSPYVREEWERASRQGKRIVLALFRSTSLPPELAACETVDFRGVFSSSLERLSSSLLTAPGSPSRRVASTFSIRRPPWVYILSLTLLVPLLSYMLLSDWADPGADPVVQALLMSVGLLLFGWYFFASFLRRRMGMTHLLVSLAFIAACMIYPLFRYAVGAALDTRSSALDLALLSHSAAMQVAAAFSLAGLVILLVVRPDDLLRWTPTGAAWNWYRRASLRRFHGACRQQPGKRKATYCLLHDRADRPAAERFRKEMLAAGIVEVPSNGAEDFIVLLTSRTRDEWLADRERELPENALLLVGTPIGLPARFEHLWRREWLDFRHWDASKVDQDLDIPKVPETVTRFRYPADVRLAHHAMCNLAAIAWASVYAIDPPLQQQPLQSAVAAVSLLTLVLAHRFLNRTISERAFFLGWKIAAAATSLLVLWALGAKSARNDSGLGFWLALAVIAAIPFLFARLHRRLDFWFPVAGMAKAPKERRLQPRRNWQTFLWMVVWAMVWLILTRAITN